MNRPGKGTLYSLTMVAVVGGMVLIGAMAISLMLAGNPAFPVTVFGDPRTSDKVTALTAIRPAERPVLPQGHITEAQLLPMPVIPVWQQILRTEADSFYARVAAVGLDGALDRARAAAQSGQRATAMRLYAQIAERFPADRTLLFERASVLASFGEHAQATALLRRALAASPNDFELQMLAARNAWWAEQALPADTILGAALALRPADTEALRLRETIRSSTQPPLAIAREWARTGAPRDQLVLARALVREGVYGEALVPYRVALGSRALRSDSLLLEASSAAVAADSVHALEVLTEEFLVMHPGDTSAVLRLARAYSWRGEYADAMRHYERVSWENPALRLEIAQVLVWSGREKDAERELRLVTQEKPRDPVALKLLGDLSLWHAEYAAASGYYARAYQVDPAMSGLSEGISAARLGEEQVRLAGLPRRVPDGYSTTVEAFSDNQTFRWFSTRANRAFTTGGGRFNAAVQQIVYQGAPTGAISRNPGASMRVDGTFDLARWGRLDVLVGAENYASVQSFAVFGGGITIFDLAGVQAGMDFHHQPAAPRAATLASLQARTTSDMLAVNLATTRGAWSSAVRGEGERFASMVGSANRLAGTATVTRTLSPQLAASIGLSAQRVDRPSPILPGFGSVIWAPSSYVEPSVGLAYRTAVAPGINATLGTQLGYGFIRERAGDQRFGTGNVPTGSVIGELQYARGRWDIAVGGSYGGALARGYRAAQLRAQAAYRVGR